MTCAALAAKDHQRKFGCTWGEALSVALKATWQAAKLARAGIRTEGGNRAAPAHPHPRTALHHARRITPAACAWRPGIGARCRAASPPCASATIGP